MGQPFSNLPGCRGKLRFDGMAAARRHADTMSERSVLVSYHCKVCGGYHNGRPAHSDEKRPRVPAYEARRERRYGCEEIRSEA